LGGFGDAASEYLANVIKRLAAFSPHPHVRRDARRLPLLILYRFALVTSCAAVLGFAIAHLS
jgi:fatty acid desaturase